MHSHDQGAGDAMQGPQATPWWKTRTGLVLCGFLAIGAYFLITEHRAHLALGVPYLPWLILLACPLMHVFMHRDHSSAEQDPGPHSH